MKKKLSLILCLCFMVLGMSACGEDPTTVDYFGMSYEGLQAAAAQDVATLVSLDDETIESIMTYGDDVSINLVTTWEDATADLGEYQSLGDFTATKTQKSVTVEQVINFSDRDVVLSYVYTYDYELEEPELTDASVDKVYTLGEKMSKAGLNTLMGMGTVFVVLILISLIIYCFRFISVIQDKLAGKKKDETKTENTVVDQIGQREEQQLTDDLELVAVISATIAASEGTSTDGFVVRSIRRR